MRALLILLGVVMLAGCSGGSSDDGGNGGGNETEVECLYTNLPYHESVPQTGAVRYIHDPAMIKEGSYYYLYFTGYGVPMRRSRDMINWEDIGQVFPQSVQPPYAGMPEWVYSNTVGFQFPWAPDITYYNGRYLLYYAVSSSNAAAFLSAIGLATNKTLDPTSPDYKWEDQGLVVKSVPQQSDFNAIDANFVLDEQGRPWLVWGSWLTGIKMHRLDPQTGLFSKEDDTIYPVASRPNSVGNIEAPFIIRHGEYYYMFLSFDRCCEGINSNYKTVVGRSRTITGPYVDRNNTPLMQGGGTVILKSYGRIIGPGHQAVFEEDGKQYLLHHFYDPLDAGISRLQIRPIVWDREGWPLAAEPYTGAPAGSLEATGSWDHSVDFARPYRITLSSGGALKKCNGEGTWSQTGNELTLGWRINGTEWPDRVYLSADGKSYVGTMPDGKIVRGNRVN